MGLDSVFGSGGGNSLNMGSSAAANVGPVTGPVVNIGGLANLKASHLAIAAAIFVALLLVWLITRRGK